MFVSDSSLFLDLLQPSSYFARSHRQEDAVQNYHRYSLPLAFTIIGDPFFCIVILFQCSHQQVILISCSK